MHPRAGRETGYTRWTGDVAAAEVAIGVRAHPGDHYIVVEPAEGQSYVAFPQIEGDTTFRHCYALVPRATPHVPVFTSSPMPTRKMDIERRSMLLSAYYRPWTLIMAASQERVCPYAGTLDMVPSSTRLRGKQMKERSYRRAWRWYVRGHVVSKTAVRVIKRALMQIPADSQEGRERDDENATADIEPLPADADVSLSSSDLREMLRRSGTAKAPAEGTSKEVHTAMQHGQKLWGAALDGRLDSATCARAPTYDTNLASAEKTWVENRRQPEQGHVGSRVRQGVPQRTRHL